MALSVVLVEVCDANAASRPELFELESEYPLMSVMENECMSECELCARHPYVFLNGELLYTDNADELILQIKEKAKKIVADPNSAL